MRPLTKKIQQNLALIICSSLFSVSNPVFAESDMQKQEKVLRARELTHQQHAEHTAPLEESQVFHGVFYGFLPCADCNGIKATLSLKQKNSYLLVTQPARESTREYYEKGKYHWDEKSQTVTLTPRAGTQLRRYYIENDSTLVQLDDQGKRMTGTGADRYVLRRSDTVKSREVHIH